MTKTVSMINLKGGVGKTQTTVALAEFLAAGHGKRVLVIDLDPQTNATVALITEDDWKAKNERNETLFQLFRDKLDNTSKFDIRNAIIKRVSNVDNGIENLDLLPSSLDLIDIQDDIPRISSGRFYLTSPSTILKNAVSSVIPDYDYVLIDCPPGLGAITLNGLYMSDYYLIPVIPDILSTTGIPQILSRVSDFAKDGNLDIMPLGIIASMYRKQSKRHNHILNTLQDNVLGKKHPPVYDTIIPLSTKAAEAADVGDAPNTLKQKYDYAAISGVYERLADEFLRRIGDE